MEDWLFRIAKGARGVVARACDHRTQDAGAGGSLQFEGNRSYTVSWRLA